MADRKNLRLQGWLGRRDRNNQTTMDATRPPAVPGEPAMVLQALTSIPDPALAYRLRVRIDGQLVDGVPWGWSVHRLPLGAHSIELFQRSGVVRRASRAMVDITLDHEHPVLHLSYSATTVGIRGGGVSVKPYEGPCDAPS